MEQYKQIKNNVHVKNYFNELSQFLHDVYLMSRGQHVDTLAKWGRDIKLLSGNDYIDNDGGFVIPEYMAADMKYIIEGNESWYLA